MLTPPKTRVEAEKYRYRVWGGEPKGRPYKPGQCAWEVHESGRGCLFYQCLRKPGHGPDALYCKQHARMVQS